MKRASIKLRLIKWSAWGLYILCLACYLFIVLTLKKNRETAAETIVGILLLVFSILHFGIKSVVLRKITDTSEYSDSSTVLEQITNGVNAVCLIFSFAITFALQIQYGSPGPYPLKRGVLVFLSLTMILHCHTIRLVGHSQFLLSHKQLSLSQKASLVEQDCSDRHS